VFVPDRAVQPSLMFASKVGTYTRGAPERTFLKGTLKTFPTKFKLDWKGLPGNKHSSLFRTLIYCVRKMLTALSTWPNVIKLFTSVIYKFCNKQEC